KKTLELAATRAGEEARNEAAVPDAIVDEAIQRDPLVIRHLDRIAELEWNAEKTKSGVPDGENNPEVKKARQLLQAAAAGLEARKKRMRPSIVANVQQRARARFQEQIGALREQLAFLGKYIEMLEAEEKRLDEGDKRLNTGSLDLEAYKEDIAQVEAVSRR